MGKGYEQAIIEEIYMATKHRKRHLFLWSWGWMNWLERKSTELRRNGQKRRELVDQMGEEGDYTKDREQLSRLRPIVFMWMDVFFFGSLAVKFFSRVALDSVLALQPPPVE